MSIDFSKLGNGSTADTVAMPREIFSVLPSKDRRYQYLRDVQAEVLNEWYGRRNHRDTVLKMNTGSGKTVVGLLIARSCLNEGFGPAVYISPDSYLVKQVLAEANALGLEVTENPESLRFRRGQAILVINIYKLINGKSVFGVGNEGAKIPIGSIIIDDVHACLSTTERQFTLVLNYASDTYHELLDLFRDDLRQQSSTTLLDIEEQDPNKNMVVPYYAWQDKIDKVEQIIHRVREEDAVKFVWPLIRETLHLARCTFGGGEVEVTLKCLPIEVIPSFLNAKRRVFMSATLSDDSVLLSHFNVDINCISRLVTPSTANDIGDRMILVPQEFNPSISDEELKEFFKHLSAIYNVVVIVPSFYRASFWEDVANDVLSTDNLYDGIQCLKDGHIGLVILVNKYDGIDLPYDACRILVIDGLPDVRRRIDKIENSILAGSEYTLTQLIQRIEQGMGRGIRSNDDQCVVFLMGRNLTGHLYAQGALRKFTHATKAQLDLSDKLCEQLRGKGLDEIEEVIKLSLDHDAAWVKASKGALVHLRYESAATVSPIVTRQRKAFTAALKGDFPGSVAEIQQAVDESQDSKIKGWLMQQLAEYTNFTNPVQSQIILKSAANHNPLVTHPIEGITYTRLSSTTQNQASACTNYMRLGCGGDANSYIIRMNALLDDIIFQPDTSDKFEAAIKELAFYIGFVGHRPEAEYKKGPDDLWRLSQSQFLVIECKNGAATDTISKHYCDQLSGSMNWFDQEYGADCFATPIIIHPVNMFSRESSPHRDARIITREKLEQLRNALRDFATMIATPSTFGNVDKVVEAQ